MSTRTIKRDMLALLEAGMPVWSSGGPGGGYRLVSQPRPLAPVAFTDREAAAVAVALAAQPASPFAAEARSALAKLLRSMPAGAHEDAYALARRVWVRGPERRSGAWRVLDEAIRRRCVVHIDYTDADGMATHRRPVEPLAYGHTGRQWYLLAWCRRRRAGRWFRLDRIERAVATHEPVEERDAATLFGEPPPDAAPITMAL